MREDLKRFLRDTKEHRMTIEQDNDVHRCLYFGRPGSVFCHYRIITWPGGLAIAGDMGDYTFSRTWDMFEFFRDTQMMNRTNPSYWHEKMRSGDKNCSALEFSPRLLEEAVLRHADDWEIRMGDYVKLKEELEDQLIDQHFSNEWEALEAVRDFRSSEGHEFYDFDSSVKEFSHHFRWCLYAIVWGIKQYDLVKQKRTQADHDRRVLNPGELTHD